MDWKYFVGLLGAAAAWAWSVYTWHRSQEEQRRQNEYNRKEGLYRELMKALTAFYRGSATSDTAPFLEQYRLSWLYAPDDVVKILNSLTETLKIQPDETQLPDFERLRLREMRNKKGGEELAQLVAAIRTDLFETARKKTKLVAKEFGHYT